MNRRLPAAVGVLAVVFGLAGVVSGATGPFSLTEVFVTVVGLLALIQGARYALERRAVDPNWTDLGEPERRYRAPTPGDDFDRHVNVSHLPVASLRRTRNRIRDAAVASLVANGVPAETAEERVESGEWTDDPVAAAFLHPGPTQVPIRDRIRALIEGRTVVQVRTSRAVAAVEAIWEDDS